MKITNKSMTAITVHPEGCQPITVSAGSTFVPTVKKVSLEIHWLPCKIEIEESETNRK